MRDVDVGALTSSFHVHIGVMSNERAANKTRGRGASVLIYLCTPTHKPSVSVNTHGKRRKFSPGLGDLRIHAQTGRV